MLELGGNIVLSGFRELKRDELIIVKKIVGNFVRKLDASQAGFRKLSLQLKSIHNSQYEITGSMQMKESEYQAEVTEHNLFFTINKVLHKLEQATKP